MSRLSDHIYIPSLAARSINLDRDTDGADLAGYVPTGRAIDTLRRIFEGLVSSTGTHAWSITGPYGCGKSSFALLLDSLCGPVSRQRNAAAALLSDVAPDVVKVSGNLVESMNGAGLLRATTVAGIEPAAATIARALRRAASRRWPTKMPRAIHRAIDVVARQPDGGGLRALIETMAGYAPVVIVIDEFGKNLEYHAADHYRELFVLQEIAEIFSGNCATAPGGILTLQHLAFEDYATNLTTAARREWAKVQGRFEDISYVDAPDQVVRLIADTIHHAPATRTMGRRLEEWGARVSKQAESLGLLEYLGDAGSIVRDCYPLHPVAAAALPALCSQYGQYERTLVSFLASGEPDSVVAFCETAPDTVPLPTVGLAEIYDYFVTAARTLTGAAAGATRWLEVESRINDARVDDDDLDLLKIVGILNLVSGNGPLRASAAMVAFAADLTGSRSDHIKQRLIQLTERGVIAHRAFADELRLWSGTDFDVSGTVAVARELLASTSPAELLNDAITASPFIAGRHSQRTGILRYFDVVYADGGADVDLPASSADGAVVFIVSNEGEKPVTFDQTHPVVVVRSTHTDEPLAAALELAAVSRVLRDYSRDLTADWVARRELQERAGQARAEVRARLANAFVPARSGVTWICDGDEVTSRRGPSGVLSAVCDRVFSGSPTVRNEMIARRELTSQGAKARRLLIEAMLLREEVDKLGIDGYGPERAMYHAVLEEPGFHRTRSDGALRLGAPLRSSDWNDVWVTLQEEFREAEVDPVSVDRIYARLGMPPIGLTAGAVPIVLTVGLMHRHDDIAIYEEGTYQPKLSAGLLERLVRNPDRYAIKNFAASTGVRSQIIHRLAEVMHVDIAPTDRRRNTTVLALMGPLLGTIRSLPEHTLRTRELGREALAVRDALLSAREPDQLLFHELPFALGLKGFPVGCANEADVETYASSLASAVRELQGHWDGLLDRVSEQLRVAMGTPLSSELRRDLAARASHLADQVLDPRLRAFLLTASEPSLDHEDWLAAVAMTAIDTPLQSWRDRDWPAFEAATAQLGGTLKRLEALNYESVAKGSTEFTARRVTVTNPDGTETSTVVVTDPNLDRAIDDVVKRLVSNAASELPPGALPALLGRLTEELVPATTSILNQQTQTESSRRHA